MLPYDVLASHDSLVFTQSGILRLCLHVAYDTSRWKAVHILYKPYAVYDVASQSYCMEACCSSFKSSFCGADLDWEQSHIDDDISKCQSATDQVSIAAKR